MTLDEALAKADRLFDPIEERTLLDAEAMIRAHGGTDEEVSDFLERQRVELARTRAEIHESVRVFHVTGFDGVSRRVN